MEPLPVKPTSIPQARKYTREFKAEGNRVFTEQEQIIIDMPPIQRTYLTKNSKIYFTFNMEFTFGYESIVANYMVPPNVKNYHPLNVFTKPLPMLDVCGPYGFFRSIEVYDYLGNTLLEKIDRHDLMASILSDFYLDAEVERLRPTISDHQALHFHYGLFPNFTQTELLESEMLANSGFPNVQTRVNGINIMDGQRAAMSELDALKVDTDHQYDIYINTPPTWASYDDYTDITTSIPYSTPTWNFSIDLLNFLGRMSDKFVPMHNGYRIVLHTNSATVPIKFGYPNGGDKMSYVGPGTGDVEAYVDANIKITKFQFSDIFLRSELLEITPELDSQVEKIVHSKMTNYLQMGRFDSPTIIPGNYLSTTGIKIAVRHQLDDSGISELGFRSSSYIVGAKLFFNDALSIEYKTPLQILNAVGEEFDTSISPASFSTVFPGSYYDPIKKTTKLVTLGTGGYMYPYLNTFFKSALSRYVPPQSAPTLYHFVNTTSDMSDSKFNMAFSRCNTNSGKFLLNFDLTLNGYSDSKIVGIDTTKTKITVDLKRSRKDHLNYVTDVFVLYDAIINVNPGKSTSVSF